MPTAPPSAADAARPPAAAPVGGPDGAGGAGAARRWPGRRSAGLLEGAAVFALCLLLGLAVTDPLVRHVTTGLPYTHAPQPGQEVVERHPGDYLQYYYHLWLLRDGVLGPTPFLRDPYEFAWGGPQPGWRTYFLPISLLYLALAPLGPFAAYNAFVLLSYGLAGLAMFALARHLVGGAGAGLVAALVFAFAPYRHAVLVGGHPAGTAFFLVPLALWTTDHALRSRRWPWSTAAGGVLLSLALTEPHYLYFVALVLPPFLLLRGLPSARLRLDPPARAAVLRGLPAVAALAAAALLVLAGRGERWLLAAALLWPLAAGLLATLWLASGLALARLRDVPLAAALPAALWCWSPVALLALAPLRLVWPVESLSPRVALLAAALVLLAHGLRLAGHPRGRASLAAAARAGLARWPLLLLGLTAAGVMLLLRSRAVGAVGSAGRSLREIGLFSPTAADWLIRFNEQAGRSIYPGLVAVGLAVVAVAALPRLSDLRARRTLGFLLGLFLAAEILSLGPNGGGPYEMLHAWLPFFGFVRQTSKLQVLAFVALALLAAAGARTLAAGVRPGWRAALLTAALAAGVVADSWPARPTGVSLLPTGNPVYQVLARPEPGRVAYVPIWPGDSSWSSLYQFATTLTRRPMINGYSPVVGRRYVEEVYEPLDHLNRGEITEVEHARLRALGVRFLVFDRSAFPPKVSPFPSGFTLERLRASRYVDLMTEAPPLWLFALRDAPRAPSGALPTTPYGFFFEAERLARRVGTAAADPDASWGRAARAGGGAGGAGFLFPGARAGGDAGGAGFLVHGAKAGLPRGDFRMTFRVRGRGAGAAPVARIEAVADGGGEVLASRVLTGADLAGGYQDQSLRFSLDRPRWVEFRVFWEGRGELAVDYLYGLFDDQRDPPEVFENDQFAFGHGPYRRFPGGRYRLHLRTRVERRLPAPMLRVAVVTAHERRELTSRTVRGVDLAAAATYEELTVPLVVPELRVLEFLIEFVAEGVSVDRIRVTREP